MSNKKIPNLQQMRKLSIAEILELRTDVHASLMDIEEQVRQSPEIQGEWIEAARSAKRIHTDRLGMIKNVLAEMAARNQEQRRTLPMGEFLFVLLDVLDRARDLIEAIEDPDRDAAALAELQEVVSEADEFLLEADVLNSKVIR